MIQENGYNKNSLPAGQSVRQAGKVFDPIETIKIKTDQHERIRFIIQAAGTQGT